MHFLPGQWVDLHLPNLVQPGGFTFTSAPGAQPLTISVRRAPANPAAAWLWRGAADVLGAAVALRVGGALVYPPPLADVRRVLFVAGGEIGRAHV